MWDKLKLSNLFANNARRESNKTSNTENDSFNEKVQKIFGRSPFLKMAEKCLDCFPLDKRDKDIITKEKVCVQLAYCYVNRPDFFNDLLSSSYKDNVIDIDDLYYIPVESIDLKELHEEVNNKPYKKRNEPLYTVTIGECEKGKVKWKKIKNPKPMVKIPDGYIQDLKDKINEATPKEESSKSSNRKAFSNSGISNSNSGIEI